METFFTIGLSDDTSMFQCLESTSKMIETTRGLIFDRKQHQSDKEVIEENKIEIILEDGEEIVNCYHKVNEIKY